MSKVLRYEEVDVIDDLGYSAMAIMDCRHVIGMRNLSDEEKAFAERMAERHQCNDKEPF